MSCQWHWSLTNALTQQVSSFTWQISVKDFPVSFSSLSTCFVVVKNMSFRKNHERLSWVQCSKQVGKNIVKKAFTSRSHLYWYRQFVEGSPRCFRSPEVKSICATFPIWRCGIPWCSKEFALINSLIQIKWLVSAAPSNTDDSLARAIWKMGSGCGRMIQLSLSTLSCL